MALSYSLHFCQVFLNTAQHLLIRENFSRLFSNVQEFGQQFETRTFVGVVPVHRLGNVLDKLMGDESLVQAGQSMHFNFEL